MNKLERIHENVLHLFRYRIGAIAIAFSISCILSVYSIKHAKNELENAALHGGRYGRAVDDPSNSTFPPIDVEDNSTKECINATFNEFPTDGLTHEQRKGGAIIIHILIVSHKNLHTNLHMNLHRKQLTKSPSRYVHH